MTELERQFCRQLRRFAEANHWKSGVPASDFCRSLGSLTIRFCLMEPAWKYLLVIERREECLDECEIHELRIEFGGPLLLSEWQFYIDGDIRGVRIVWRRVNRDIVDYGKAHEWLERYRVQEGLAPCVESDEAAPAGRSA